MQPQDNPLDPESPLGRFGPATRDWFEAAFPAATNAQNGAWRAISHGHHALVVAPTGSGKTLAAFLWALDRLTTQPRPEDPQRRCRVIYVSPLRALAVDVERNLRAPLAGMRAAAARLGLPASDIRIAMRTGDTPAAERRGFVRDPADVLITTPESLFLLLTSGARDVLRGVEAVIVDEVHAVCTTKRGAHLALSLERLDAFLDKPAQRIGLSATVRPIDEVARFLGGEAPVEIVEAPAEKVIEIAVEVPVDDMTQLDVVEPGVVEPERTGQPRTGSIWPLVESRVLDLVLDHRSTIVFANSRRLAERFCARLNEEAAERTMPPSDLGATESPGQPGSIKVAGKTSMPAAVMAQSALSLGAPTVVARAHHGSVSQAERRSIEDQLKSGTLPAVVATSSLELGIDMGAVDLVVQVEAPPSVASGLQRIGRAGHQVGAVSRGVLFPRHRGDLAPCAVVAERMRRGEIEHLAYPRNPLDVLAQHIVAMVAMDPWSVDDLAAVVRRSAPFAKLPRSALDAVLDMLAGRYPSHAFGELRPRIVWDRSTDQLTARPGAARLAVTSGGTIPDRGLYGVYLAGASEGRTPKRVGELDEEMVYESRVGDVFMLGSSSWRIEEITPDRVLVSPAPGAPARMPFWKGDGIGRPAELGQAIGELQRAVNDALVRAEPAPLLARLREAGLDERAIKNLIAYATEQRESVRAIPDDRTIVVERFRDELGDWRLVVHSVFGDRVNAPWALAIGRRIQDRWGVEPQIGHADDGIVVRLPDTADEAPSAELVTFDADEIMEIVTEAVGGSALFAGRFRECAARALLLPRRDPRRRQPLWQQRQRSAQLLDVARDFPDFPISLEAVRECLHDVYDLDGLVTLTNGIADRTVKVVEVAPDKPSPYARSLLFGYVGAFLYEGDAPLAERRAAALALDPTLLAELLGRADLRELLDPEIVAETERRLQWLSDDRRPRDAEDTADILRLLGDLSTQEAAARGIDVDWLATLAVDRRAVEIRVAGELRWIAIEDAGRYRDAAGVALPVGIPAAFTDPVPAPLVDLVGRYVRTHGPVVIDQLAQRWSLDTPSIGRALSLLVDAGRVVRGEFLAGGAGEEWCDAEVLRLLRRRSLAALRREIEPVEPVALARFMPRWQHVGGATGPDGLAQAIDRLQGAFLPSSALERLILPARVADYSPAMIDELCASGELLWAGGGAIGADDGWVTLVYADAAPLLLPPPDDTVPVGPLHESILDVLGDGQAMFFRTLADRITAEDSAVEAAIWELVWAGWLSNDTLTPLRARLGGSGAHRGKATPARPRLHRARLGRSSLGAVSRPGLSSVPPQLAGRWYQLPERDLDPTARRAALAESLLDRYGLLTRGSTVAENAEGGFAGVYPVLAAMEDRGAIRRGYFVEGLGAAQFAVPGAVDQLRDGAAAGAWVLAATDPANPYGAALPWPPRPEVEGPVHRAGRKAGAIVVLIDGALVLWVERGGRTVLTFGADEASLAPAAGAFADAVRAGRLGAVTVERVDGTPVAESPLVAVLREAGFRDTPRGLRLRP